MTSQGIPDSFIRRSLGVVRQAPPPIPRFIDTVHPLRKRGKRGVRRRIKEDAVPSAFSAPPRLLTTKPRYSQIVKSKAPNTGPQTVI